MAKEKFPVTAAVRFLRQAKAGFEEYLYEYEERGGTAVAARELGLDEHYMIKTLIMENERKEPLIILMHGDREVSTKELARFLGCKTVTPCAPETANKYSGYLVGGTSPFATRREMPVYMEESILILSKAYINGGKRGYLVCIDPKELIQLLKPILVKVGITS
jgi:Cys-tRNA(Pro) deacylase